MVIIKSFLITLALATNGSIAFSPCVPTSATSSTQLYFGIPTFGAGQNKNKNDDNKSGENKKNEKAMPEKKIGLSGLTQLITAGMGSPFRGDFEGGGGGWGCVVLKVGYGILVYEFLCNLRRTQA